MLSSEFKVKHLGVIGNKWCKFLGRLYRFVNGHFEVMIPPSYFMEVITESKRALRSFTSSLGPWVIVWSVTEV